MNKLLTYYIGESSEEYYRMREYIKYWAYENELDIIVDWDNTGCSV